jgi:hypothetical protein
MRSTLTGAGRLQYDRETNIVTLTIWPNLFTGTIRIQSEDADAFRSPSSRERRQPNLTGTF